MFLSMCNSSILVFHINAALGRECPKSFISWNKLCVTCIFAILHLHPKILKAFYYIHFCIIEWFLILCCFPFLSNCCQNVHGKNTNLILESLITTILKQRNPVGQNPKNLKILKVIIMIFYLQHKLYRWWQFQLVKVGDSDHIMK